MTKSNPYVTRMVPVACRERRSANSEPINDPDVIGRSKPNWSERMKRTSLALSTAILLMATVQSFAQSASISIEPEQRTHIKEYVVKERVPRVAVKERYRVGT